MTEPRFKSREEYEAWKAQPRDAPSQGTASQPAPINPPAKSSRMGWWKKLPLWGKIGVVLLVLAILGSLPRSRPGDTPSAGWSACKNAVRDKLKAPATAKFTEPTVVKDQERGVGVITAAVDAHNSFGAMLRTNFMCTVKKSADYWVVDQVTMLPR